MTTLSDSPANLQDPSAATPSLASPRRVLHVVNGEHYAGAERVQDLLALRLGEFGYEVGFACLKRGRFATLRRAQRAQLLELPMRARGDLRPVWQLARLARRGGYCLIHTHTPRAALVGRLAAWLTGVPLVHHLHSPTTVDSTHRWRNRGSALAERLSLVGAGAVIAVSRSLGQYAERLRVPGARIAIVPNGVGVLGPLPARARPSGVWTLGTVALFRPRKGLEVLLDALALLRAAGRPVRLRAIGAFETPAYEARIRGQAGRLGLDDQIDWIGFAQDVPAELAQVDLFVLPSLFGEGLPMVILEAMAAGVPVIGTRVEGIPEAVRDTLDGLIAEPNDAGDLARAVCEVLDGQLDWQHLRESAHRRQAECFSDVSMAEGVAAVYDRVLAG